MEDLEARLVKLVQLVEISESEATKRANFRHCLEEVLVKYFPSVEIQPFGSSACGLGLTGSDLDLHVELNTNLDRKGKTAAQAQVLWAHKRFRNALPILDCRTPIVQLFDKKTGIKCDLSGCSSMGVLNTQFVKFCLDFDPRTRTLALVIKYFAKKHHITGFLLICCLSDPMSWGLALVTISQVTVWSSWSSSSCKCRGSFTLLPLSRVSRDSRRWLSTTSISAFARILQNFPLFPLERAQVLWNCCMDSSDSLPILTSRQIRLVSSKASQLLGWREWWVFDQHLA